MQGGHWLGDIKRINNCINNCMAGASFMPDHTVDVNFVDLEAGDGISWREDCRGGAIGQTT